MKNIVGLAHMMETVMSRVRERELPVTPALVEALLRGIDKLRVMLDDVPRSDSISYTAEQALLQSLIAPGGQPPQAKPDTENLPVEAVNDIRRKHPQFSDAVIFEAIRNGKLIYQITVDHNAELVKKNRGMKQLLEEWEKFGVVADCVPPVEKIDKTKRQSIGEISVLFTTVLEADLLSEAIGVGPDSFFAIDLTPYKEKLASGAKPAGETAASAAQTAARQPEAQAGNRIEDALRVKISLLNGLMNCAGELVLARNQLLQTSSRRFSEFDKAATFSKNIREWIVALLKKNSLSGQGAAGRSSQSLESDLAALDKRIMAELSFPISEIQGINGIVQNLDMVTTMLQEGIMQTRLQPLAVVFSKFPRVIRDLSKKLGKQIVLTQVGQDVELDKSIIEQLSDPLTHLVRNSVDHGIESPEKRAAAGKGATGTVILKARQEGGKVIIEIIDDGAGIDIAAVKRKAVEKGICTRDKAGGMSDKDAQLLIFMPGFSTAAQVSDLSGRGVGMDVVKTNIERLGGTVEVMSESGQGTTITLKLPLTLAIIPSLIVTSEDRRFAIPQVGLEEIVRIRAKDLTKKVERIYNAEVLRLRGKLLPLVRLSRVLGIETTFVHKPDLEREADNRTRWSDRRGTPESAATQPSEKRASPDRFRDRAGRRRGADRTETRNALPQDGRRERKRADQQENGGHRQYAGTDGRRGERPVITLLPGRWGRYACPIRHVLYQRRSVRDRRAPGQGNQPQPRHHRGESGAGIRRGTDEPSRADRDDHRSGGPSGTRQKAPHRRYLLHRPENETGDRTDGPGGSFDRNDRQGHHRPDRRPDRRHDHRRER